MEMQITEETDAIIRVVLAGRLDTVGSEEIRGAFMDRVAWGKKPAVIDLSGIEFLSSMGIVLLLTCARALKEVGAGMVLLKPQPAVEQVLTAAGLATAVSIAHDEEEALSLLQAE